MLTSPARAMLSLGSRSGALVRRVGLGLNIMLFLAVLAASGTPLVLAAIFLSFPAAMATVHRWEVALWVANPLTTELWKLQPSWGRSFPPAVMLAGATAALLNLTGYFSALLAGLGLCAAIAATYAAGKAGCVPMGCCRAPQRSRQRIPLPLVEAAVAETIFLFLLAAMVANWGLVAVIAGSISLIGLRTASLKLRR